MSLATFAVLLACASSASALTGLTYEGKLMKPDGITPEEDSAVQFKVQIRTGDTFDCLMLEDSQTINMTGSGGNFALTVGAGARTDNNGISIEKILSNNGSLTFGTLACMGGGETFIPGPTQIRKLVISFTDSTLANVYQSFPPQVINFAPSAVYAQISSQVGDFASGNLLRATQGDGVTPVTAPPLLPAMLTELNALIGGTSAQYAKQSGPAGTIVATAGGSGNVATPAAGSVWLDTTGGNLKFYDGTTVKTVGTSSGSVITVSTGAGLTGGPITTSGTIALSTLGSGGTGYKVTYDTYGRVTGAVALAEIDIPILSTAGHVSGSAITTGTIGGSTVMNTTGNLITMGSVGIGTTTPIAKLDVNQVTAGLIALQGQASGTAFWKVLNPAGSISATWNPANAVEYVGKDTGTNRSINAAGTVNTSGADFAEWVEWLAGPKPEMGSVILYRGSYVVVSSPFTAAFVGNDVRDAEHSILVAFAGQLPVRVRGVVHQGDLIIANDDGTGSAVNKDQITLAISKKAVGTAWEASEDSGLKRVNVAVGIGLGGNGARDIASVKAEAAKLEAQTTKNKAEGDARAAKFESENQKLKQENNAMKARLDKIEKVLNSK